MDNIILIELASSAINYVDDAINLGYKPIVFFEKPNSDKPTHFQEVTLNNIKKFKDKIEYYEIDNNYEKTLELAKKLNPKCVLNCVDSGTLLKEKLCFDLGLPHNSPEYFKCYMEKFPMQEALKNYGIRYIKSKIIHNIDEGIEFYEKEKLQSCVIKQACGAASFGLHICESKDDLVRYLKLEFDNTNLISGSKCTEMIIQEKIEGKEYIVNTISKEGDHNLLSVWEYSKIPATNGSYVYNYCENMYKLKQGSYELVKYAFDVLDALHFKNGPVHGEFMVDKKGPVLIEVNCRPMGGCVPPGLLDVAHGHHETDNVLGDITNPNYHKVYKELPYCPMAKAIMKFFISDTDKKIISIPGLILLKNLKSFYSLDLIRKNDEYLKKTVDLFSSPATVFLLNENESQANKDLDLLCRIEKTNFELIYQTIQPKIEDKPKSMKSIEDVYNKYCSFGSTIILTNNKDFDLPAFIVDAQKVKKVTSGFHNAIFDYNFVDNLDLPELIDSFFDLIKCLKKGGRILVPERAYWFLHKKQAYIEALCECANLEINAFKNDGQEVLVADKL